MRLYYTVLMDGELEQFHCFELAGVGDLDESVLADIRGNLTGAMERALEGTGAEFDGIRVGRGSIEVVADVLTKLPWEVGLGLSAYALSEGIHTAVGNGVYAGVRSVWGWLKRDGGTLAPQRIEQLQASGDLFGDRPAGRQSGLKHDRVHSRGDAD